MEEESVDNVELIRRSPRGLQIQVFTTAIVTLLIGFLGSWLIGIAFGWTSGGGSLASLTMWVVLVLIWAVSTFTLWFDWQIKRYEFSPDALIVHARIGQFGSTQSMYRYESILEVRMAQGFLGKQFNYGDIFLTIPKLNKEVVMNDIENPIRQVATIQKRLGEKGGSAMVV
jgi:membrane protein YdbS with pleckstrin-like domain